MSSQALPPHPHPYCVWGENRLGSYDNLELGLPGTGLSSLQGTALDLSHFLSQVSLNLIQPYTSGKCHENQDFGSRSPVEPLLADVLKHSGPLCPHL
jgi:hypothetical protein